MEIKRAGSRPSGKGPAEWFTGAVRVDPLFEAPAPARVRGASVMVGYYRDQEATDACMVDGELVLARRHAI